MQLSDGEKLIILLLTNLYKKLGVEGDMEPDFIEKAILEEKLWAIPWRYSGITFSDTDDPPVVGEVLDILEMWYLIEIRYEDLDDNEKKQLYEKLDEVARAVNGDKPFFGGFDGNNEYEYLSTARFLVEEMDRFTHFKGRVFNSHSPLSLDMHRRMLAEYRKYRRHFPDASPDASVDALAAVLNARPHPDSRSHS